MKITVTATSTSVKDLIETSLYDFNIIEANRIKTKDTSNSFGIYIKNSGANSIYLENMYTATLTTSLEIPTGGDFSLDVAELSKLNLIMTSGTQDIYIIVT